MVKWVQEKRQLNILSLLCESLLSSKFTPYRLYKIHNIHNLYSYIYIYIYLSERWVVCLCNEPTAVQSARHDSRLKFLPIT